MTTKRTHKPTNDSGNDPGNDNKAAADSAHESAPEPDLESAPEPAPEPDLESALEPDLESDPAPEPESEPDLESAPEPSAATADGETEEAATLEADEGKPRADEIAALKERLLRALAELENTRRRGEREREMAAKYAISAFAREMLGIADNLRRALDSVPPGAIKANKALRALENGVALTEKELLAVFKRHHIRRIEPLGEKFNPEFHHAVFERPDNDHPPGTVVEVLQVGYLLNDRLLRPAMVAVGKSGEGDEKLPQRVDTIV